MSQQIQISHLCEMKLKVMGRNADVDVADADDNADDDES